MRRNTFIFGLIFCLSFSAFAVGPGDYGPQYSVKQISDAVNFSSRPNESTMRQGSWVSLETTTQLESGYSQIIGQRLDQILERHENIQDVSLNIQVENREPSNNGWHSWYMNYNVIIAKYRPDAVMDAFHLSAPNATYHNLKVQSGYLPDCGGIQPCLTGLNYYQVSFDRVLWGNNSDGEKTQFSLMYSPDIPTYVDRWENMSDLYLTDLLQLCTETNLNERWCRKVRGFNFGR